MRFFFADPGLRNNVGHHANADRSLIQELRRRDVTLRVLAFHDVEADLQAELGAEPFFHWPLYATSDGHPLSGWLNAFEKGSLTTATDLGRLYALEADDLLYMPFVLPAQLKAVALWMASHPPARLPRIAVGFTFAPGLDLEPGSEGLNWAARDPRVDPSAILFGNAASHIPPAVANRLLLIYPERVGATLYNGLVGRPVALIPHHQHRSTSARNRAGARPITVSVLGDQRGPDKGYHLLPELVPGLLQSHPEIRVLIHNANPANWPAAQEAVRTLAHADNRVEVHEGAHDSAGWSTLLERTDLLLCPYAPPAYQLVASGIHNEAVANAIPSVVPGGTAMARILSDFGNAGTTFADWTVPSILDATRRALDDFDMLALAAHAGAAQWPLSHGPEKYVDGLLAYWRG